MTESFGLCRRSADGDARSSVLRRNRLLPPIPSPRSLRSAWTDAKTNFRRRPTSCPRRSTASSPSTASAASGRSSRTSPAPAYEFCAAAKGEKTPHAEDEFEKSAKTKADIVKALDGAIAYCDERHTRSLDDAKAAQMVDGAFGGTEGAARRRLLIGNTGHCPGALRQPRDVSADQRPRAASSAPQQVTESPMNDCRTRHRRQLALVAVAIAPIQLSGARHASRFPNSGERRRAGRVPRRREGSPQLPVRRSRGRVPARAEGRSRRSPWPTGARR